jgi:DNA-binding transcriptional MerR regulator
MPNYDGIVYPDPVIMRTYATEEHLNRKQEVEVLENIYFPLSEMTQYARDEDLKACERICKLVKSRIAELYGGPQF